VLAPVKVVQIARGVFEAQLHVAEDLDHLCALRLVCQPEHPEFRGTRVVRRSRRHEVQHLGQGALPLGPDLGVAGAVSALVAVQRGPHRLPGRAPVLTGVLPAEIDVTAGLVGRQGVVAIAAHPAVARVAVNEKPPAVLEMMPP